MALQYEQLALDLFPVPTFDEVIAQDSSRHITVTVSARLKRGWYVRARRGRQQRELVVPKYLAEASVDVKRMLIEWATQPKPRKGSATAARRREIEERIHKYVESLGLDAKRLHNPVNPDKFESTTAGCTFDLKEIFQYLNSLHFADALQSRLRWGRSATTTSYQSFRYNKDGTRYSLITIAGVYNHPAVPQFALESVMYHEMLHLVHPPRQENGRRLIHPPEFVQAERAYKHFAAWREWERTHVRRLARAIKRKKRADARKGRKGILGALQGLFGQDAVAG